MDRLRAAKPPYPDLFAGALLWGMQMLAAAMLGLYLRNGLQTSRLGEVAALYFLGGLLSWPFALPVARFLAYNRPPEARFAAFFVTLTAATILMRQRRLPVPGDRPTPFPAAGARLPCRKQLSSCQTHALRLPPVFATGALKQFRQKCPAVLPGKARSDFAGNCVSDAQTS
jgi:hypothetical protein